MAGTITCTEDGSNYEQETSTFLKEAEVAELKNMFKKGGLNTIQSDFIAVINSAVGLKPKMLNIAGRAPLSELSKGLVTRLKVTIEDVTDIPLIAEAESNKHRLKEANNYWDKVQNMHKKLKKETIEAARAYNTRVRNKNDDIDNYNNEHKNDPNFVKKSHYTELTINEDETFRVIENKDDITGVFNPEATTVRESYKLLGLFKTKYDKAHDTAKEYQEQLKPTSVDGYRVCISEGEKLPKGVQVGAKKQVVGQGDKIIYTNPDGSIVEVVDKKTPVGKGPSRTVTIRNKNGYPTSTIEYDDTGKQLSEKEYKYKRTDIDGVYETTITTKGKNETVEKKYTYYDGDGNYQIKDEMPKEYEVKKYDDPKQYYAEKSSEDWKEWKETDWDTTNSKSHDDRLVDGNEFKEYDFSGSSNGSIPSGYSFTGGYRPDEEMIENARQADEDRKENAKIIQPSSDLENQSQNGNYQTPLINQPR